MGIYEGVGQKLEGRNRMRSAFLKNKKIKTLI
jgi:hypothetical protein